MSERRVSNMEIKRINRNRIFRYVNNNERVSKPDISAALGISIPTVLQNINELIEKGLVQEVGEFKSTGGRKAVAIASIKDAYYALGIDITQNHIGLVLTNLSGEVLRHSRIYYPYKHSREYYQEMANIALEFLKKEGISDNEFLGAGISIPGIIDDKKKKIAYSHALNVSDIDYDNFCEFIPYKCVFINDANAASIAEMYHVENRFNAVYLSLSNSVGGAIIEERQLYLGGNIINNMNDLLYLGDNWRGGEFGHMTLIPGGKQCYCGKKGCFDAYCSAKALTKYTDGKLEEFFKRLEKGDEKLYQIWDKYLSLLAIEVNNLRMVFDCTIIIGGYVGSFIEPYISKLREKAAKLNTFESDGSYIKPCLYPVEASALGAALQQVESYICKV